MSVRYSARSKNNKNVVCASAIILAFSSAFDGIPRVIHRTFDQILAELPNKYFVQIKSRQLYYSRCTNLYSSRSVKSTTSSFLPLSAIYASITTDSITLTISVRIFSSYNCGFFCNFF